MIYLIISIIILVYCVGWLGLKAANALSKARFINSCSRDTNMIITIAFAVGCGDSRISQASIKIIQQWADKNISEAKRNRTFYRAISSTGEFFLSGETIDFAGMCSELAENTNSSQRYDIVNLCISVISSSRSATSRQLEMLQQLTEIFQLDTVKISTMIETLLPGDPAKIKNVKFVLGIDSLMTNQQAQSKLSREYKKWNSRITNPDKNIRQQAQTMIELIADLNKKLA